MKVRHTVAYLIGFTFLITGWHYAALRLGNMVLATPANTLVSLAELLWQRTFWLQLAVSGERLFYGLSVATVTGITIGLSAGRLSAIKYFLEPFRWVMMSIPPVIVVLLAMLWFGMGSSMVVFITASLLTPTVYLATLKGIENIDQRWLHLVEVYHIPVWLRIRQVYLPAISPSITTALVIVCCNGVRILVLAEVLGTHNGLGYALADARSGFNTGELYAWVLVSLLLVAALEFALLRPVQKRFNRWQSWR